MGASLPGKYNITFAILDFLHTCSFPALKRLTIDWVGFDEVRRRRF